MKNRPVIAKGHEREENLTEKRHKATFEGDRNALYLDSDVITHPLCVCVYLDS